MNSDTGKMYAGLSAMKELLEEFLKQYEAMRFCQRAFYAQEQGTPRKKELLEESKRLERALDSRASDLRKSLTGTQQELF